MVERKPSAVRISRWRGSGAASAMNASGISGISSGSPVRITCAEPTSAAGSSGYRRSYSSAIGRSEASAIAIASRTMLPSGWTSSTNAQSA